MMDYYKEFLGDVVQFQKTTDDSYSNVWFVAIKLNSKKQKERVFDKLISENIEVKVNYTPATLLKWVVTHSDFDSDVCLNSNDLFEKSLLLPSGLNVSSFEDIKLICDDIKGVL